MDPNDLRAIVEREIVDLIEPTAWQRCVLVNKAEQESLRDILDKWCGAMIRQRLPNRRASTVFSFECNGLNYTASASWFDDGKLGEVFVGNHRADSHADACAKDAAILASIALQFGAPLDVLRKALLRDSQGRPSTPIGCALDLIGSAFVAQTAE
jgi:ribonucleoside-diphosphate reductase alpha chain